MLTLKTKRKDEDYPAHQCAVVRCGATPSVIDASKRHWPDAVPLCQKHWEARCSND